MAIHGCVGPLGGGKTLHFAQKALANAERDKKFIVTNIKFDLANVRKYAAKRKWQWLLKIATYGGIIYVPPTSEGAFLDTLNYRRTIALIDECNIFVPQRPAAGYQIPWTFFSDILLSRKAEIDILWIGQIYKGVDSRLREVSLTITESHSLKQGRPSWNLFFTCLFNRRAYERWEPSPHNALGTVVKFGGKYSVTLGNQELYGLFDTTDDLGCKSNLKDVELDYERRYRCADILHPGFVGPLQSHQDIGRIVSERSGSWESELQPLCPEPVVSQTQSKRRNLFEGLE